MRTTNGSSYTVRRDSSLVHSSLNVVALPSHALSIMLNFLENTFVSTFFFFFSCSSIISHPQLRRPRALYPNTKSPSFPHSIRHRPPSSSARAGYCGSGTFVFSARLTKRFFFNYLPSLTHSIHTTHNSSMITSSIWIISLTSPQRFKKR